MSYMEGDGEGLQMSSGSSHNRSQPLLIGLLLGYSVQLMDTGGSVRRADVLKGNC